MTRWFEDLTPGEQVELGQYQFDAAEADAFAAIYEPYLGTGSGHVSGWLVALTGHRLMLQQMFAHADEIRAEGGIPGEPGPAPGMNFLEFPSPVTVGETVKYKRTFGEKRLSKSLPGWGIVDNRVEGWLLTGRLVYRTGFVNFMKTRERIDA